MCVYIVRYMLFLKQALNVCFFSLEIEPEPIMLSEFNITGVPREWSLELYVSLCQFGGASIYDPNFVSQNNSF